MKENKQNRKNKKYKENLLIKTLPGRLAAKKMGKLGGRPKKLKSEKILLCKKLYEDPNNKVESICKILGISKPTLYAYLRDRHVKKIDVK